MIVKNATNIYKTNTFKHYIAVKLVRITINQYKDCILKVSLDGGGNEKTRKNDWHTVGN